MKADLHSHSHFSDGKFSPSTLVQMAKDAKLDYFALSDHDTLCGVEEAVKKGEELAITVIPAIELSCYFNSDVHILGYGIDYKSDSFDGILQQVQQKRVERNFIILDKLKEFGIEIGMDELIAYGEGRVYGRTQIGELMVKHGYVNSVKEAFDDFLSSNGKAYINAFRLTPKEAIELILSEGGTPILAHPNQLRLSRAEVFDFINELKSFGLVGIESYYYTHTDADVEFYENVANNLKLINTAGSDFHGSNRSNVLGKVPREMTQKAIDRLIRGV
ncbi:MAG: PHP domain-containing protein [Clostridia bacterium]